MNSFASFHFDSDQKYRQALRIDENHVSTSAEMKKKASLEQIAGAPAAVNGHKSAGKLKENGVKNGTISANGNQLEFTESLLASAKENDMVQKYLVAETKKFSLKS